MSSKSSRPLYIKVDPADNVAIIVNEGGLPAGAQFESGLVLTEPVPEAHKVALVDLPAGSAVIRYGVVIGHTQMDIAKGGWVHDGNIDLPAPPSLENLPVATDLPAPAAPLEGFTFEGYVNADGSVGTKNILGITTTVQCVAPTVDFAVKRIKAELLPKYPNVDDVIALTHPYGCGIAIDAPGAEIPIRTLRNLALNPEPRRRAARRQPGLREAAARAADPRQHAPDPLGGAVPGPPAGRAASQLRRDGRSHHGDGREAPGTADKRRRTTRPASDLVVGLQCGGSDAFSGVTANPAVGYAADLLVRAGATVMFSEVTEVRDGIHLLTARAANKKVAADLVREMAWYDAYLGRGSVDRSANPSPGNKQGGLTNIVEKALGSIAKAGTSPIAGVYGPGEQVKTKGLVFAATPAGDFICGTLQLAASMNMHVFTTGRGTPYGLAMVPVIKVASRTSLAERWKDLIDVNAGTIASGDETIEQVGKRIFDLILDVASGRKETWADHWGLHNEIALFNPSPVT